jgi:hypothetical protein
MRYAMAYGGVKIHIFLDFGTNLEWSASRPGRFTPEERAPGIHWIGSWVDPRDGLDDVDNRKFLTLPGRELRPLVRPVRSQSLYRLRYLKVSYRNVQGIKKTCESTRPATEFGSTISAITILYTTLVRYATDSKIDAVCGR